MKNKEIFDYLEELIVDPKCELNYNKDYELLIAVMLSAQTTDKRVNQVTTVLFNKYDSLYKLSKADVNDVIDIIRSIGTFNKNVTNWLNIVARAAPLIPISSPNINIGSKIIFKIPPIHNLHIA